MAYQRVNYDWNSLIKEKYQPTPEEILGLAYESVVMQRLIGSTKGYFSTEEKLKLLEEYEHIRMIAEKIEGDRDIPPSFS